MQMSLHIDKVNKTKLQSYNKAFQDQRGTVGYFQDRLIPKDI